MKLESILQQYRGEWNRLQAIPVNQRNEWYMLDIRRIGTAIEDQEIEAGKWRRKFEPMWVAMQVPSS